MRKSILFRTITVLLAAATLLSSTSAYNLLVYANQEITSATLSATGDEDKFEPNITVQGGELQTQSVEEQDTNSVADGETNSFSWGTYPNPENPDEPIYANGSKEYPYQISDLEHLLAVNNVVNDDQGNIFADSATDKYFVLTADIDISPLADMENPFVEGTGYAYLVSTDYKNIDSEEIYINIDGSYTDTNGDSQRYKIWGGESGWDVEISGHQYFSIFGYLGSKSVVQNIIFENIRVNVTNANPRGISIVSYKNDGLIQNCSVNNCTITSSLSSNHRDSFYYDNATGTVAFYNGIAGAVVDNGEKGKLDAVKVNNLKIDVRNGEDDYIGAVVSQNRGLVDSCAVSGIKITGADPETSSAQNFYIGGIAGYNVPAAEHLGVQNCSVDMGGTGDTKTICNFTFGKYIGGLVGNNEGYLYNSSVTGTVDSATVPTERNYNISSKVYYNCADKSYFGGAAGISTGRIVNVTVSDVGFFFRASAKTKIAYYGGITSTVKNADSIVSCIATGSFASSEDANIYAGGVIGYADKDIAAAAISNTYTLYKIDNPTKDYIGAVIGWGGNSAAMSGCYWSDHVSGCASSYIKADEFYTDLVAGGDAVTGNLYSANKGVIVGRNSSGTVSKDSLIHSWGAVGVSIGVPSADLNVPTNGHNNSFTSYAYSVPVSFAEAGVGSSDKREFDVAFEIDVFVTTANGDPDSINDPMEISSSAQVHYIYRAPYGHFKLSQNNISVAGDAWEAPVFYGTIDGDGYTLETDTPLFKIVIGSRDTDIGAIAISNGETATDPAEDTNDLSRGCIKNINVALSDNINTSVFGSLINATFLNVELTDGDTAEDDNNSSTFDGFYVTLNQKRDAAFAASANGYSYIYGCSTSVSAYVDKDGNGSSYNDQAIFIAKVTGNTTIDNCYINSVIHIMHGSDNNSGRAAFLGNISENKGYVLNCAVNAGVDRVASVLIGHCPVIFGEIDTSASNNNYGKYKNIVWSKSEPDMPLTPYKNTVNVDMSQLVLWGAELSSSSFAYPTKIVSAGIQMALTIDVPKNIKAFENTTASDFVVSEYHKYVSDETEIESLFEIISVDYADGKLTYVVRAKDTAEVGDKGYIRVFHSPSGISTFVTISIKASGLVYEDGYYIISSASDLKFLADHYKDSDPNHSGYYYKDAAYILGSDIDMAGIEISPIGDTTNRFTGIFTCPVDENGQPLYSVSNFTVTRKTDDNKLTDNVGLFGVVDFSGEDKQVGSSTLPRGISNISLTDVTVEGKNNVAVLVGYAGDPDVSSNNSDDNYGKVSIKNIIVKNSVVFAGDNASDGKNAAAVLAFSDSAIVDIQGVVIENVKVASYYDKADSKYFLSREDSNTDYSGGIGGVIGAVDNCYYDDADMTSTMSVNIKNVDISGLSLFRYIDKSTVGDSKEWRYVPLNAGAVVGTFFTKYGTNTQKHPFMNIGDSAYSGDVYDINICDTVILSKGNAGGVLGATNVKTAINSVHVYGSENPVGVTGDTLTGMTVRSETNFAIGGIAGYIGIKVGDNAAAPFDGAANISKAYGSVTNSLVEQADIRFVNSTAAQLTRNTTVGGIVGAINGNKEGYAVYGSTLKNSHIEGVVVGGIVGAGVETNGEKDKVVSDNSININSCSVRGSEIMTTPGCLPATEIYDGLMSYGVGGILGTNRKTLYNYAQHTSIQRCLVDGETVITNSISAVSPDENGYNAVHAATGGILGAGFENGNDVGMLELKYNEVYAKIVSNGEIPESTAAPAVGAAWHQTLSATGGIVGALIGNQYKEYAAEYYEVCDLSKVSVQHAIFGGSIIGSNGIGGAIGVISAASAYANTNPSNLISDIAVTGSLASTFDNSVYRGGIVIGHIAIKSNGVDNSTDSTYYAFDAAANTDITGIFNKIYFSSFGVDSSKFPIFGYLNATSGTISSAYSPLADNAQTMLRACYEDINKLDGNLTVQFGDTSSSNEEWVPSAGTYIPSATRPLNEIVDGKINVNYKSDGNFSVADQKWDGSNDSIADVESTGPDNLKVLPKNTGTISVMIDYVGKIGDASWEKSVNITAGFRFTSQNQAPLSSVTYNGETYYLITSPADLSIIGKNMNEGENKGKYDTTHMGLNYWLTGNIDISNDMFEKDGLFEGGFTPIGTVSGTTVTYVPFTGTFSSVPAGVTYTVGNETVTSTGDKYRISGLQLKSGTQVGLFAEVNGATFENFVLENVSGQVADTTLTTAADSYLGAIAAKVTDCVTVNNVTVSGVNLTGADYTGGFFGGILASTNDSSFTNVSLLGNLEDDTYSNIIGAYCGAAGIVAHTSHNNANITNVVVEDAKITQEKPSGATSTSSGIGKISDYHDLGAAGISMAYAGTISATDGSKNRVEGCDITAEIASAVVTRTYTSTSATAFTSHAATTTSNTAPAKRASVLEIKNLDVKATSVTGTHTRDTSGTTTVRYFVASGGILARVDASFVQHTISDCTLDSETYIKAPFAAGGIVGSLESPNTEPTATVATPHYLTVFDCESYATVELTNTNSATPTTNSNRANMGAGAVLGYLGKYNSYAHVSISNTVAGGRIRGYGNIGGLIGAIWTQRDTPKFATDSHFAENCVISAELETPDASSESGYSSAFSSGLNGVGIVVGYVYGTHTTLTGTNIYQSLSFTEANYPFYNIYFSDAVYADENNVRLYGQASYSNFQNISYISDFTDHIFNLNRTGAYSIDSTSYVLSFVEDTNRIVVNISGTPESEKHILKLNYNNILASGYQIKPENFYIDASVIDSDDFAFNATTNVNDIPTVPLDSFTVSAKDSASVSADAQSTEFVLQSITCSDSRITVVSANGEYKLTTQTLAGGVDAQLYFNYSNGLTLSITLEIEIKPEDFWFKPNAQNSAVDDFLVFNAANLSFVNKRAAATSNIIQCYDVFWTVANDSDVSAVNAALAGKTLADVYSAEFIATLNDYKHPNPLYDGTEATERYVTFDVLFNTTPETRGTVLLSELVGTVQKTEYDAYGEDCGAAIYNRSDAFKGSYTVLESGINTGCTEAGQTYKLYGLELRSDKVNVPDSLYAGMFTKIGEGAVISDITFVNPVIKVVNSSGADDYVGVLAGDITGATVTNVTITETNGFDSKVVSARRMTAAGTNVGALAGNIGVGTTVENINIDGIEVVGAATQDNRATNASAMKYVYVGGVAGSTAGNINNVTLNNVEVYANRFVARGYISYAGGIAGQAYGNITNASLNVLVGGADVPPPEVDQTTRIANVTYTPDLTGEYADRVGGVVGLASGSLTVEGAVVNKIADSEVTVNAFDVAGGVIAEIANDESISVTIKACDIGSDTNPAKVSIVGSTNVAGKIYGRMFYNAVGGIVGYVNNVASLTVTDCDFNGYVGQYDLIKRNCTAGGVIGLVGENLTSLDNIIIGTSTVQGEVTGYYNKPNSDNANPRIFGAAGGIIGKIYNYAYKSNAGTTMISQSVMSAKVNLYNSAAGNTVKADYVDENGNINYLEMTDDPNVGKIIGGLRNDSNGENFAKTATDETGSGITFTKYVSEVYVSSYPQNIIPFGCKSFYNNQYPANDPKLTYIDINKENRYLTAEDEAESTVSSFMVDGTVVTDTSVPPTDYNTNTYTGTALITFDDEQADQSVESSRYFRLKYENIVIDDSSNKSITFDNKFAISVEDTTEDLSGITVVPNHYSSSAPNLTETVGTDHSYDYYAGVITVKSNSNIDVVGYISAKYTYGLEVGINFISMEIAGDGSSINPFQIAIPKHFKVVRALKGANYLQVANIDFADPANNQYLHTTPGALHAEDGKGFDPIGDAAGPFTGTYDGNGYVISNVYIFDPLAKYVGFFGYVGTGNNRATLKNIHIELASGIEASDGNSNIKTVSGGITGNKEVGGLVGYAKNATITNCSVANGFVMGETKVGGLVGATGNAELNSCFTSTSTYSYSTSSLSGNNKNVGGLVGSSGLSTVIAKSFVLGFVSVGTTSDSGVAGGLVGFAESSGELSISHSLVAATVSDYNGNKVGENSYKGMTVGLAGNNAIVRAEEVTVASANTFGRIDGVVSNPILGGTTTADVKNIYVDTDVTGEFTGSEEYTAVTKVNGLYNFAVDTSAAGDVYTAAYVALAVIPLEMDSNEVADRTADTPIRVPGYFYPVTLSNNGEYKFSSSVIDETDLVAYPSGIDKDLYGIQTEENNNRNTDLLFRDHDGKTTVYPNVFPKESSTDILNGAVLNDGTVHPNKEVAYCVSMPYFDMNGSVTVHGQTFETERKVYYPIQTRRTGGEINYAVCTARQLFALSNLEEKVTIDGVDSKFRDFYTLSGNSDSAKRRYTITADIDLDGRNFTPIVGYEGTMDGKGYTVDNLTINMSSQNEVAMFRTLDSATIKNLNLGVKNINGKDNVGGLVGAIIADDADSENSNSAMVRIENCHVKQSASGSGIVATGSNVGGLAGAVTRSNANSEYGIFDSSSSVSVSGKDVVGGLIGYCEVPVNGSYSTGSVNGEFTSKSATAIISHIINGEEEATKGSLPSSEYHGIGGLIGVLNMSDVDNVAAASVNSCFTSGIVDVAKAQYAQNSTYGVGGLVGIDSAGANIAVSFSSGNVYYCYEQAEKSPNCDNVTVGVGGLIGVLKNDLTNVYSSSSVAAEFGDVSNATAVGTGGVVGISYATLSESYSSGSTLSVTSTADYSNCNYGMGGVIGLLDSKSICSTLKYDLNVSITDKVVGKIMEGSSLNTGNSGAMTTDYLTSESDFMGFAFGYAEGAYPYLRDFFLNEVSLTVRINALLSVVALQIDERDTSAAEGKGISMALKVPSGFSFPNAGADYSENVGDYTYSYNDDLILPGAASGVIDNQTGTLSVQRTQNQAQYVNFVITVAEKDKNPVDNKTGQLYSSVANRTVSRLCAPMLGNETYPYLVSTQEDLKHVGMTNEELRDCNPVNEPMYCQWATPILENGDPISGPLYFRMMGNISLANYDRAPIPDLTGETYTIGSDEFIFDGLNFDGNGYSIRNLQTRLYETIDEKSSLTNMTFEKVSFSTVDGKSAPGLIGTVNGRVEGVSIFGTAIGSNTAALASTVGKTGQVTGVLANVDHNDTAHVGNIAGLVLKNEGLIEMSASVGNFSGTSVAGLGGIAVENSGEIKNSFTIGNIKYPVQTTAVSSNVGGFVNTNTGTITNCYTRCNISVNNVANDVVGGFAARNSGTISSAYSSGLFELTGDESVDLYSIFVADNSNGTFENCMFDKQMSGQQFKNIYNLAERTLDIINLTNHQNTMVGDNAYTLSGYDSENKPYENIYYPQLSVILGTEFDPDSAPVDMTAAEKYDLERRSRMYNLLRAYSFISSATVLVEDDNYIDNLAPSSRSALSFDTNAEHRDLWMKTSGSDNASISFYGTSASAKTGNNIFASAAPTQPYETSVITAAVKMINFYGNEIYYDDAKTDAVKAKLDIFAKVTDGVHPNFGGTDAESGRLLIKNPEHVVALSFYGTNPANRFLVNNDIDMTPTVWTAYIDNFKADLDGNNKVLSNVVIGADGNDSLFGTVNGGKIDSLGISGINVTVDGSSGGMLASKATNGAQITNSFAVGEVTVSDTATADSIRVGGLVGEIDNATIDGCVVSGKVDSTGAAPSASVKLGGAVGSASDGSTVSNVLSTVFVNGRHIDVAGGIVATSSGNVNVNNCVFASDVKAVTKGINGAADQLGTAGNLVGDSDGKVNITSCYYDKQMTSVDEAENGVSTYYLTSGATMEQLGFSDKMTRIDGFAGYPVPVAFANATGSFGDGVKFASARISLSSGAGAGSLNSFTAISAPQNFSAALVEDSDYLAGTGTQLETVTSQLKLGQVVGSQVTYELGNMVRYFDLNIGKTLKVIYNISGLDATAAAVLNVLPGMSNISSVNAFATAGKHTNQLLCSSMVIPYDSAEQGYVLRVSTELPSGVRTSAASAVAYNGDSSVLSASADEAEDNGMFKLTMKTQEGQTYSCDTIIINITVAEDSVWGIHKYINLF